MILDARLAAFAQAVALKFNTLSVGSNAASSTTVTVAPAQYGTATVQVNHAGAQPAAKVMCWLAPNADYDADELDDITVVAMASVGAIDFTLNSNGPIVGSFNINYTLG